VPVVPVTLAIDSAGKFLFVADASTIDSSANPVGGAVSVFSIGSGASLTEVSRGRLFSLPNEPGGTDPRSLGVSSHAPPLFPLQNATCSGRTAPSSEFLYVADFRQ